MDRNPFSFTPLPPRVAIPAAGLGMTWAGLRLGSSPLLLCGLVLLFAAVAAALISAQTRRGLRVLRRHQARVFEDGTAHVQLQIQNRGRLPLLGVEMRDNFPPAESFRVRLMDRRTLRPRHALGLTYRRVCSRRRGVYTLGPLRVAGADPAGIFPFELEVPEFSDLLVYPKSSELSFFPLLGDGTLTRIGEEIQPEAGDSAEFRGVRDWRPGDGLRGVHWPTTARLGRLMAKEFEQDVVTEVTIALDLRRMALTGLGEHTTLEYAVKAAASIAQAATERQHLVQLWGLGSKSRRHVPFGTGPRHLNLVLDQLTLVRADGEGAFESVFNEIIPTLRPGATLVPVLSAAAVPWDAVTPTLRALVTDGVKLVVVLLDDRSLPMVYGAQTDLHRDAPALKELVLDLRGLGASVFTVADREDVRCRLETPA